MPPDFFADGPEENEKCRMLTPNRNACSQTHNGTKTELQAEDDSGVSVNDCSKGVLQYCGPSAEERNLGM